MSPEAADPDGLVALYADEMASARPFEAQECPEGLVAVLDYVRTHGSVTRSALIDATGLSRNLVTRRIASLIDYGLVDERGRAPSTGGRAARMLHFRAEAGYLLVADLGATSIDVAVADLAGAIVARLHEPADISDGPTVILDRVDELFRLCVEEAGDRLPRALWGIGIGVPGPVEFESGRPIAPPIMPGWDGYSVRGRFAKYGVPVWVDNDVNVMALGELTAGSGRGIENFVFVKIGTGIGAGIIVHGELHRGAQGCAGDVGHIQVTPDGDRVVVCRCGNIGCLEALAGGAALARDAEAAARDGRSPFLQGLLEEKGSLHAEDVTLGAAHGDAVSIELLTNAGRTIGRALASIVNFFNPSLIVIGGGVAGAGERLLATIREGVYRRSLPLATRDLVVRRSTLGDLAGVTGAATMVANELFAPDCLVRWLGTGSPDAQLAS